MATTADFRNGLVLDIDGQLYQIVYFQHVKPGKGGAFVRTKLKNIRTGAVLDRTYNAGERVTDVRLRAPADPVLLRATGTSTTSWTSRPSTTSCSPTR